MEALKLKKHKGIKEIRLEGLSHINVICGKNNSGKTAIAEAICNEATRAAGRKITEKNITLITERFKSAAKGFSSPDPRITVPWFEQEIYKKLGQIIYLDEGDLIQKELGENFHHIIKHGPNTFNFKNMLSTFITEETGSFKPFLIPPKRFLAPRSHVNTLNPSSVSQNDINILNRLFVLSTQDNKSKDFSLIELIRNSFREISGGFNFHTAIDKENIVIKFQNAQGDWIDAESNGLGLRDALVILHYLLDSDYSAIIIEEPENHLHPDMQRRLLKFFSQAKDKQLFLTTHSNIYLDSSYVDKVFYLEYKNGETVSSDATSRTSILTNLGYSAVDNMVSDLIVFTEGILDIPVIKEICDKLGFWHKYSIKLYPLMGDIMHYLDLSVFTEKNKVMALVDSDPGSKEIREEFVSKCEENNIIVTRLNRYSTENYFSIRAIQKIYPYQKIPEELKELKPDEKVKKQLGFNIKSKSREITQEMSLEEFKDTDLLEFCRKINEILIKEQV